MPAWVTDTQYRLEKIRHATVAVEAEARANAQATHTRRAGHAEARPQRGRPPLYPPGVPRDRAQRHCTDPDSRIMKTTAGFVHGDNAQAAVDAASQIIVAHRVTAAAHDRQPLAPMGAQIKPNTGRQARELSADAVRTPTSESRIGVISVAPSRRAGNNTGTPRLAEAVRRRVGLEHDPCR